MRHLLDINTLKRTYRDPIAWVILGVDLFPIIAVFVFGWGAAALVFLYWLENLVIGGVALARMIAASVSRTLWGLLGIAFLGPFFVVHYGMFCFVHGIFLVGFTEIGGGIRNDMPAPMAIVDGALNAGAYMELFLWVIIALQAFLYVRDFIWRGQYRETDVGEEMFKPYGRVMVLHVGLFVAAGAMAAYGEPLWGIVGLIVLRAIWGVFLTMRRRMRLDGDLPQQKVDGPSPI